MLYVSTWQSIAKWSFPFKINSKNYVHNEIGIHYNMIQRPLVLYLFKQTELKRNIPWKRKLFPFLLHKYIQNEKKSICVFMSDQIFILFVQGEYYFHIKIQWTGESRERKLTFKMMLMIIKLWMDMKKKSQKSKKTSKEH